MRMVRARGRLDHRLFNRSRSWLEGAQDGGRAGGRDGKRPVSFVTLIVLLGAAACSVGAGDGGDAAAHDYVIPDVTLGDVPEACAHGQGNEKGVGAPCSMGGGECRRYGSLICACEPLLGYMLPGAPCICTIPIFGQTCQQIPSDYCGSNATCCSYQNVGSACFPNACLDMAMCPMEPVDTPDAGDPSDAGLSPD
ncbi:MAG TPA: hypothetical protein VIU64_06205 [Polyangia bacterium]